MILFPMGWPVIAPALEWPGIQATATGHILREILRYPAGFSID